MKIKEHWTFGKWKKNTIHKLLRHKHCFLTLYWEEDGTMVGRMWSCACGYRRELVKGVNSKETLKLIETCSYNTQIRQDTEGNTYIC